MSPITHCPDCGHGLIPTLSNNGRTELACIWCEKIDPPRTVTRAGESGAGTACAEVRS